MLIGFSACYSLLWIDVDPLPIGFIVGTLAVSLLHTLFVCIMSYCGLMCCNVAFFGIVAVIAMGLQIAAVMFVGKTSYHRTLENLWNGWPSKYEYDMKINLENMFMCCGWNNSKFSVVKECLSRLGISEAPLCRDAALGKQAKIFDALAITGLALLVVFHMVITVTIVLWIGKCRALVSNG
jgi:hypothetical protein